MPKKTAAKKSAPKKVKSPAVAAPALAGPAALPPGETATIDLAALHASPLNPRKDFNDATVAELAESIAANGILQNLVVRRRPRGGFEIIAGERRFRALTLLADVGRWDRAAAAIPVRIVDGDEGTMRALALLENLQREDISPMEEAEAFAALHAIDPEAWSTASIAQRIGKTQRHVQKRMELVEKLDPKVQGALRAREINLEQAKAFVLGAGKMQLEVLRSIKGAPGWQSNPQHIREMMTAKMVPLATAFFDPALYQGEVVENEDEGERYFADAAQFKQLQDAAIEEKRGALAAKWPWVNLLGPNDSTWNYQPAKKGDKKAGAYIHVDYRGRVEVKESVLAPRSARDEKPTTGKAAKKKAVKREDLKWLTRSQVEAIKVAKTTALRAAVAESGKAALCLAIIGLLGDTEVDIRDDQVLNGIQRWTPPTKPRLIEIEARRQVLKPLLEAISAKRTRGEIVDRPGKANVEPEDQAAAFIALIALTDAELLAMLAMLVAPRIGSWVTRDASPGDSPLSIVVAEFTGAAGCLDLGWAPTPEYFAASRRETLQNLAAYTEHREGFNPLKKGEQVKLLSKLPKGFWTADRFAEMQFLDQDGIQKAMAGPARVPAVVKAEVARLNREMVSAASAKGRCRECNAHEGGKHNKRCSIGKAGEKRVSSASCAETAAAAASEQPFGDRWWRVGGEPGVDEHAEEVGRELGYVDQDHVGLEFADGSKAAFLPHALFPADPPTPAEALEADEIAAPGDEQDPEETFADLAEGEPPAQAAHCTDCAG